MALRFIEESPNSGVDDTVGPTPLMIVPLKGTNRILLIDGEGLDVVPENPKMLKVTKVKGFVRKDLSNPTMWEIKSLALPGTFMVQVRQGTTVVKKLSVFVLDQRVVRLAVRPLQTAKGVFHAKVVPDPVAFVDDMNDIWNDQANVQINLVSTKPLLIDDPPDEIAREIGAFEADGFTLDETKGVFKVSIQLLDNPPLRSFAPVFLSHLESDPIKNADFTLIVVHAIAAFLGTNGLTDPSKKFATLAEYAGGRDWAHELGHHLGAGDSRVSDALMVSGGTGWKISVQDVLDVFNPLKP